MTHIIKSNNTLFALIILLEHLKCLSVLFACQPTQMPRNVIALAYKILVTELHSNDAGYTHLTSGLLRSLKKLVDGLFHLNKIQYLPKGLNL